MLVPAVGFNSLYYYQPLKTTGFEIVGQYKFSEFISKFPEYLGKVVILVQNL